MFVVIIITPATITEACTVTYAASVIVVVVIVVVVVVVAVVIVVVAAAVVVVVVVVVVIVSTNIHEISPLKMQYGIGVHCFSPTMNICPNLVNKSDRYLI